MLSDFNGLRQLCEELLASEGKLAHLGLDKASARRTVSEANTKRSYLVFEMIYYGLLSQYHSFTSDSRVKKIKYPKPEDHRQYYHPAFSDLLHGVGRNRLDGGRKKERH